MMFCAGSLDVAGFAADAVLRVDDEERVRLLRLVGVDDTIDARRAIESGRLALAAKRSFAKLSRQIRCSSEVA